MDQFCALAWTPSPTNPVIQNEPPVRGSYVDLDNCG
jgi:hypothetical protein